MVEPSKLPHARRNRAALTLCAVAAPILGCAPAAPRPIGATPAVAAAGPLPEGPSPPRHGLPIPSLDVDWTPPGVVAGDPGALVEALAGHRHVGVQLGPRLSGPSQAARVVQSLEALAPATAFDYRGRRTMTDLLAPGTTLPVERRPTRSDIAPRYEVDQVRLATDWNAGRESTGEATALLVLDDAPVDAATWRSLPAHATGSCDRAFAALAVGQEQSLAYLEPFLDHGDRVLWQVYQAELRTYLPSIAEELGPYAEVKTRAQLETQSGWEQYQCGHAYWEYLQNFTACGGEQSGCPTAPRVYLMGGLRIGTAEPTFFIPEECATTVGRDYVVELRHLASEAAQVARDHLDLQWVVLADRLGALTDVHAALEDVCTPRRRRLIEDDVEEARRRLVRIGEALASDAIERRGGWVIEDGQFRLPGVGPVRQVARFEAGRGSSAEQVMLEARSLRNFVLGRAHCRSADPPLPLSALVLDARTERATFLGFHYDEELVCEELLPLGVKAPVETSPASEG